MTPMSFSIIIVASICPDGSVPGPPYGLTSTDINPRRYNRMAFPLISSSNVTLCHMTTIVCVSKYYQFSDVYFSNSHRLFFVCSAPWLNLRSHFLRRNIFVRASAVHSTTCLSLGLSHGKVNKSSSWYCIHNLFGWLRTGKFAGLRVV